MLPQFFLDFSSLLHCISNDDIIYPKIVQVKLVDLDQNGWSIWSWDWWNISFYAFEARGPIYELLGLC